MTKSFPNTQLIISLLLFAWAVCTFDYVSPYVFKPSLSHDHIIDVHNHIRLFKKPLHVIDSEYVIQAANRYIRGRYLAYFILDILFPIIYSAAFLYMARAIREKYWRFFFRCVIIGGIFDVLENTCFYIFLYNRNSTYWAVLTSVFTGCKFILFIFNILFSLAAFFAPRMFRPFNEWKRFYKYKRYLKGKAQLQYL